MQHNHWICWQVEQNKNSASLTQLEYTKKVYYVSISVQLHKLINIGFRYLAGYKHYVENSGKKETLNEYDW